MTLMSIDSANLRACFGSSQLSNWRTTCIGCIGGSRNQGRNGFELHRYICLSDCKIGCINRCFVLLKEFTQWTVTKLLLYRTEILRLRLRIVLILLDRRMVMTPTATNYFSFHRNSAMIMQPKNRRAMKRRTEVQNENQVPKQDRIEVFREFHRFEWNNVTTMTRLLSYSVSLGQAKRLLMPLQKCHEDYPVFSLKMAQIACFHDSCCQLQFCFQWATVPLWLVFLRDTSCFVFIICPNYPQYAWNDFNTFGSTNVDVSKSSRSRNWILSRLNQLQNNFRVCPRNLPRGLFLT